MRPGRYVVNDDRERRVVGNGFEMVAKKEETKLEETVAQTETLDQSVKENMENPDQSETTKTKPLVNKKKRRIRKFWLIISEVLLAIFICMGGVGILTYRQVKQMKCSSGRYQHN